MEALDGVGRADMEAPLWRGESARGLPNAPDRRDPVGWSVRRSDVGLCRGSVPSSIFPFHLVAHPSLTFTLFPLPPAIAGRNFRAISAVYSRGRLR